MADGQKARPLEPRPPIYERRRFCCVKAIQRVRKEYYENSLALERRRLENRSREEGPGNARARTASGAETSVFHPAREGQLSQAVLWGSRPVEAAARRGLWIQGMLILSLNHLLHERFSLTFSE